MHRFGHIYFVVCIHVTTLQYNIIQISKKLTSVSPKRCQNNTIPEGAKRQNETKQLKAVRLWLTRRTYPACRWARWPDPPAWAPAWPHVALPATGHTGRRLRDRGRAAVLTGCEDSWGSATGHRISRRTIPGDERREKGQFLMIKNDEIKWLNRKFPTKVRELNFCGWKHS